jgi:hypothetical protein
LDVAERSQADPAVNNARQVGLGGHLHPEDAMTAQLAKHTLDYGVSSR